MANEQQTANELLLAVRNLMRSHYEAMLVMDKIDAHDGANWTDLLTWLASGGADVTQAEFTAIYQSMGAMDAWLDENNSQHRNRLLKA